MTRHQRPTPLNQELSTDPYGHLTWAIGSGDDFWCFDFCQNVDGTLTLHGVIHSDTGHFIQDAERPSQYRRTGPTRQRNGWWRKPWIGASRMTLSTTPKAGTRTRAISGAAFSGR